MSQFFDNTLNALRQAVTHSGTGTRAALKRAELDSPPAVFYQLTVRVLDENVGHDGERREQVERKWLGVAILLARGAECLGHVPLGEALAHAGVTEARLLRLLAARGDALFAVARAGIHQIVSKGQSFSPKQLAELLVFEGTESAERVRRTIARDYFRSVTV